MENTENIKNKPTPKEIFIRIALLAVLAASVLLLGDFSIYVMLLPAFYAFVCVRWGMPYFVGGIAALLVPIACLYSVVNMGLLALCIVPSALIIGIGFEKHKPYRSILLAASVALVLGVAALSVVPSYLYNGDPYAFYSLLIDGIMDEMSANPDTLNLTELTLQNALSTLETMRSYLSTVLPALFITGGIAFAGIDICICRKLCNKRGHGEKGGVLLPMTKFARWQLSQNFTIVSAMVIVVGAICYLAGLFSGIGGGIALGAIIAVPFIVQGASYTAFVSRRGCVGNSPILILGILLLVFYGILPALGVLFALGVMEQFLHVRKRFDKLDRERRDIDRHDDTDGGKYF